jgi:hypothetical protein
MATLTLGGRISVEIADEEISGSRELANRPAKSMGPWRYPDKPPRSTDHPCRGSSKVANDLATQA